MAAATGSGEALCVEVIEPGRAEPMISRRPDHCREWQRRVGLPTRDQVGRNPVVLEAEHLAGAPEAGLHLVHGEDDIVLAAERLQLLRVFHREKSGPPP